LSLLAVEFLFFSRSGKDVRGKLKEAMRDWIEHFYRGRNLHVFYAASSMSEAMSGRPFNSQNAFYFQCMPEQGRMGEVGAMQK